MGRTGTDGRGEPMQREAETAYWDLEGVSGNWTGAGGGCGPGRQGKAEAQLWNSLMLQLING